MPKRKLKEVPRALGQLKVSKSSAYGKNRFKPENELASQFAKLCKLDYFLDEHVECIKTIGFSVLQVPPQFEPTEL